MEKMKKVQLTKNNQDQGVGENFLRQKRRVSLTPQSLPGCQEKIGPRKKYRYRKKNSGRRHTLLDAS